MTDITIAALRAEVERLTGERDRQYDQNAEQIIRIAALEAENERLKKEALFTAISVLPEKDAENERLRAALDKICNGQRDADLDYAELFVEVKLEARAALEEER